MSHDFHDDGSPPTPVKPKAVRPLSSSLFSSAKTKDVVSGSVTWIAPGSQGVNNWKAGRLVDGDGETVKFVGSCMVKVGDAVRLHGEWEDNEQWGRQFRVAYASAAIGRNYDAIRRLLETDDSFREIGPRRALYITDFLKDRRLDLEDVLESDELLSELAFAAKLPSEAVTHLVSSWSEKREENITKAELIGLGVPTNKLEVVWNAYRLMAVETVRNNPYVLTETIDGFSLADADKVAKALHISESDPRRITCGIMSTMRGIVGDGHTWVTRHKLGAETVRVLNIGRSGDHQRAKDAVAGLLEGGRLKSLELQGVDSEIVCQPDLLNHEQKFVVAFGPHAKDEANKWFASKPLTKDEIQAAAKHVNSAWGKPFEPSPKQIEAVEAFAAHRFMALTGAAGTGKSATVTMILKVCEDRELNVALAAPTGKAAMRLNELANRAKLTAAPTAMTIHKTLGYQGERWLYHEKNKLPVDVLIVDEFSMVDLPLMSRLLDALMPSTAVVLVGDHNQLPPVGPGAAFRDVIEGELCRVVRLDVVFRQAGALRRNAAEVLRGVMTPTTLDGEVETWRVEDWHKDPQQAHDAIAARYRGLLEQLGERGLFEVQVLSPMYKGAVGIDMLNKTLRAIAHEILYSEHVDPDRAITVGDKVIQTKNDYQIGVMNGDQGIVKSTRGYRNDESGRNEAGWVVEIQRGDQTEEVNVPLNRTSGFMLAYAISVHRFQGSESEHVIGAVHSEHKHMLTRPLIYTTSTRASKTLTLVGDRDGLYEGAKRADSAHRRTLTAPRWLIDRIRQDRSA